MSCENGSAARCVVRQLGELPVSPETVIVAGVGLAMVGIVTMWAGRSRAGRRPHRTSQSTGPCGALTCTVASAGVITTMEWAVISQTDQAWVWVVVLGLPAFLAGATAVRLLAAVRTVHTRRRQARNVLRGAGESR